jgi:hypothetical protein
MMTAMKMRKRFGVGMMIKCDRFGVPMTNDDFEYRMLRADNSLAMQTSLPSCIKF